MLTTHAGSLPRTPELTALLVRKSRREPVDPAALERAIVDSTRRVVARQLAAGVDVGNDGEQARESFFTYVQHRMSGFGGTSDRPVMRDILHYRTFLELPANDPLRRLLHRRGERRGVDRLPAAEAHVHLDERRRTREAPGVRGQDVPLALLHRASVALAGCPE